MAGDVKNDVSIGFKAIVVLIIVLLAIASFLSFVNDYPALGWFFLGLFGAVVLCWILLAGNGNTIVYILLAVSVLSVLISYLAGVPGEWKKLTNQTESAKLEPQGTATRLV